MGYLLRRALADVLPPGISHGERLVALEVADQASDTTGIAYGVEFLTVVARRAGLANGKQVGRLLGELAARDLELRQRIGVDKRGRPVFACRGHATTYDVGSVATRLGKVPHFRDLFPRTGEEKGPANPGPLPEKGPGSGGERSRLRGTKVPEPRDPSPKLLLSSQLASSQLRTKPVDKVDRVIARHAPDLDRATVAGYLTEQGKGLGVVAAADGDGTAPDLFAKIRAWAKPTDQPPRFADWNTKPPGCGAPGCSNGKIEDPNDDYRPYPCPACQPQRVNGHRP